MAHATRKYHASNIQQQRSSSINLKSRWFYWFFIGHHPVSIQFELSIKCPIASSSAHPLATISNPFMSKLLFKCPFLTELRLNGTHVSSFINARPLS